MLLAAETYPMEVEVAGKVLTKRCRGAYPFECVLSQLYPDAYIYASEWPLVGKSRWPFSGKWESVQLMKEIDDLLFQRIAQVVILNETGDPVLRIAEYTGMTLEECTARLNAVGFKLRWELQRENAAAESGFASEELGKYDAVLGFLREIGITRYEPDRIVSMAYGYTKCLMKDDPVKVRVRELVERAYETYKAGTFRAGYSWDDRECFGSSPADKAADMFVNGHWLTALQPDGDYNYEPRWREKLIELANGQEK